MSRLIASILLSVLLFPLAGILYLITFFVCVEMRWFARYRDDAGFLVAGLITAPFVAWYWIAVWRKTVNWTPARASRTRTAAALAIGVALPVGALTGMLERDFGFFIATVLAPLLWLMATVLVWRETNAERSARLRRQNRRGDGPAVPCPTCGYDMTGLKGTRCPECGCEFTVDEILASQPGRAAVELER